MIKRPVEYHTAIIAIDNSAASPPSAYAEGRALSAEVLAREIPGAYPDPYTRFGQMTSEIWWTERSIRHLAPCGYREAQRH
ncbi:MAG: hypothetical protein ACI81O_002607 [Cyclobacteriaceae bacterium]|jgi:hypothetical protein